MNCQSNFWKHSFEISKKIKQTPAFVVGKFNQKVNKCIFNLAKRNKKLTIK